MLLSKLQALLRRPAALQRVVKGGKKLFAPKYLLYTNIVLSGSLSAFGDFIQQTLQFGSSKKQESSTSHEAWHWDPKRTAKMFTAGVVLAPCIHYWYLSLDKFFPGTALRTLLIKILLDLFMFSPVYILLFLLCTEILEETSLKKYKREVRDKMGSLFEVELFLWTPVQFINFFLVPSRFRVLYDNFISLIGDIIASYIKFDYIVDDEEDDK